MSADLIIIGDQSGCAWCISAPIAVRCGLDIDVPLYRSKFRSWFPGGATAARMSCPGAMMSGLRMSPPPAGIGPRDENAAVNGASALKTIVPLVRLAVLAAIAAASTVSYSAVAEALVSPPRWIDGTKCRSALTELTVGLIMIIPAPPACLTARLLSMRALMPRSQTTILPADAGRLPG